MTNDLTDYAKVGRLESRPPLCLVHYLAERAASPPPPRGKPPGESVTGRVAARDGNLIILEFAPAPQAGRPRRSRKSRLARLCDFLFASLFLASLLGCFLALRC